MIVRGTGVCVVGVGGAALGWFAVREGQGQDVAKMVLDSGVGQRSGQDGGVCRLVERLGHG